MDESGERYAGRKGVLERALQYTTVDRNKSYGEPDDDFQRIARTLTALGYRAPNGGEILGHDVSVIMISLKLSRLTWQPTHQDSWDDIAGYAACGSETAFLQEVRAKSKTPGEKVVRDLTFAQEAAQANAELEESMRRRRHVSAG
jgi:Domain of unknown function (DUF6378)